MKSVKLGDLKGAISEHFTAEGQLLLMLTNVTNEKVRAGLLLRVVALQAQSSANLIAVLVASGVPLDLVTKAADYGEEVADLGVKEASERLKVAISNDGGA